MTRYTNNERTLGFVKFANGTTQFLFFKQFIESSAKVVKTSSGINVKDVTKRKQDKSEILENAGE